MRPLALLLALLLAPLALGEEVTVSFAGHSATLEGDGFAQLRSGDSWRGDVAVHWPEIVVLNGAVENYCGPDGITGPLTVHVDGVLLFYEEAVTIEDACGRVIYADPLTFAPDARGARWLKWYQGGGPALTDAGDVDGFAWGGPDPDPVDAGATGSGRVAWVRWPLGSAIMLQRNAGGTYTAQQWLEVMRWAGAQWDRAYNYYHALDGYRRWEAWQDPDAIVGVGYRSGGGFWKTYGRTELHGRTHVSGGKYPPDEQHADIAGLVWTAAATGSWAARRAAASLIETRCSFPPMSAGSKTWSNSVRELGWIGRCLALQYALTGEDWCLRYIDRLAFILDDVGGHQGSRFWAHLAKPKTSNNGYVWLTPAVIQALDEAGYTRDEGGELLKQTSGWQSAILGITCGLMADAMAINEPEGWELRAATWSKHELVIAILVLENLSAKGYDQNTLEVIEPRLPGEHGFNLVASLAPKVRVIRPAQHNYAVGTGLVTVGFVEQFARRNPRHAKQAHAFADQWVDYLIGASYVDGGWLKANLDRLYLTAGRRGWLPD